MVESTKKAVADQLERAAIKAGAGGSALDARRAAEVKKQKEAQFSTASTASMIPGEKVDDFGLHAHKYYKMEHNVFKS